MAEEAQVVVVTNTGQPLATQITPATSDDVALATVAKTPPSETVTIAPAAA